MARTHRRLIALIIVHSLIANADLAAIPTACSLAPKVNVAPITYTAQALLQPTANAHLVPVTNHRVVEWWRGALRKGRRNEQGSISARHLVGVAGIGVLAGLLYVNSQQGTLGPVAFAFGAMVAFLALQIAGHEMGHGFTARHFGLRVKWHPRTPGVSFLPAEVAQLRVIQDIQITAAGLAFNVALSVASGLGFLLTGFDLRELLHVGPFAEIADPYRLMISFNLLFSVFLGIFLIATNLLPKESDGHRIFWFLRASRKVALRHRIPFGKVLRERTIAEILREFPDNPWNDDSPPPVTPAGNSGRPNTRNSGGFLFLQNGLAASSPWATSAFLLAASYWYSTFILASQPFSLSPKIARLRRIYLSPIIGGILNMGVFVCIWLPSLKLERWREFDPQLLIGLGIMNALALFVAATHLALVIPTRIGMDLRRTLPRLLRLEENEATYLLPRLKGWSTNPTPGQVRIFVDSVRLLNPHQVYLRVISYCLPVISAVEVFPIIRDLGVVAPLLCVMVVTLTAGLLTENLFKRKWYGLQSAGRLWIHSPPGMKSSSERFVIVHETTHAILKEDSMPDAVMTLRMAEFLGKEAGHILTPAMRFDRMIAAFPALLNEASRADLQEGYEAMENALRGDPGWEARVQQLAATRHADRRGIIPVENYSWSLRIGGMAIALLDHVPPAPGDQSGGIPWAFIRGMDACMDPGQVMNWLARNFPNLPPHWLTSAPAEHTHRQLLPAA